MKIELQKGFTLIEFALVMVIVGILSGAFFSAFALYKQREYHTRTQENLTKAEKVMTALRAENNSFPCPADLTLPPSDPNFGVGDCAAFAALAMNTCSASGGICKVQGARDANEDLDATNDNVLIGAFPLKDPTMSFNELREIDAGVKDLTDAWGNKLFYAVTESLTVSPMNANYGAIELVDEFDEPTGGILQNGHYVIFSAGRNENGAYAVSGAQVEACNPAMTLEAENCNFATSLDSKFVNALYNRGSAADYFDDYIVYSTSLDTNLWSRPLGSEHLKNKNVGRVGVNTEDPEVQFHVEGGAIKTHSNVATPAVCDKVNDSKCLETQKLIVDSPPAGVAGQGIRCPSGQILTGIRNTDEVCTPITLPTATATCPSGTALRGVYTNGEIECTPIPTLP